MATAQADSAGAWTAPVIALTEGRHTVKASITDVAGNTSVASEALRVTVDKTAPAAPTIDGVTDDTGASDSDGVTSATTVTVSGTAEAGAYVDLFVNGGSSAFRTVQADEFGAWSVTDGTPDGTYTLTAKARDAASRAAMPLEVALISIGSGRFES